jgi:uncharacterized membrane protein YuzA (DUF378 family)
MPLTLRLLTFVSIGFNLAASFWLAGTGAAADLIAGNAGDRALVLSLPILGAMLMGYGFWRARNPRSGLISTAIFGLPDTLLTGYTFIVIGLCGSMVFGAHFEHMWLIGLLPGSIAAFWLVTEQRAASELNKQSENESPGSSSAPETGIIKAGFLPGWLLSIVLMVLMVAWLITALMSGYFFFGLVNSILFEDRTIAWERIGSPLSDVASLAGIYIAAIGAVLAAFIGIRALVVRWARRQSGVSSSDYSRPLTNAENAFIDDAQSQFESIDTDRKYPAGISWAYWLSQVGCIFAFIAIGPAIVFGFVFGLSHLLYPPAGTDEIAFRMTVGPSLTLGVFWGILIGWPVSQFIISRSPNLAEYAYVRGGWNSSSNEPRTPEFLTWKAEDLVRKRLLDTSRPFDLIYFLRVVIDEYGPLVRRVVATLTVVTFAFAVLDANFVRYYSPTEIRWSPYFGFGLAITSYDEIDYVETACHIERDDGEEELRFRYEMYNSDGIRFSLDDHFRPHNFNLIEQIDERLTQAGVEFQHRADSDGNPRVDRRCLGFLDDRFGTDADRVARLLRVSRD